MAQVRVDLNSYETFEIIGSDNSYFHISFHNLRFKLGKLVEGP